MREVLKNDGWKRVRLVRLSKLGGYNLLAKRRLVFAHAKPAYNPPMDIRLGKRDRESGVYKLIHEHFEIFFNDISE